MFWSALLAYLPLFLLPAAGACIVLHILERRGALDRWLAGAWLRGLVWLHLRSTGARLVRLRDPLGAARGPRIHHLLLARGGIFPITAYHGYGRLHARRGGAPWTWVRRRRPPLRVPDPRGDEEACRQAVATALGVPRAVVHPIIALFGIELRGPIPANVTAGADFASYVRGFRRSRFAPTELARIEATIVGTAVAGGPACPTPRGSVQP